VAPKPPNTIFFHLFGGIYVAVKVDVEVSVKLYGFAGAGNGVPPLCEDTKIESRAN
jgi:hypothetical protein